MSITTYTPKIKVTDVASHRNGICGAPFHVVLFEALQLHLLREIRS
jgi:hypothetical protein